MTLEYVLGDRVSQDIRSTSAIKYELILSTFFSEVEFVTSDGSSVRCWGSPCNLYCCLIFSILWQEDLCLCWSWGFWWGCCNVERSHVGQFTLTIHVACRNLDIYYHSSGESSNLITILQRVCDDLCLSNNSSLSHIKVNCVLIQWETSIALRELPSQQDGCCSRWLEYQTSDLWWDDTFMNNDNIALCALADLVSRSHMSLVGVADLKTWEYCVGYKGVPSCIKHESWWVTAKVIKVHFIGKGLWVHTDWSLRIPCYRNRWFLCLRDYPQVWWRVRYQANCHCECFRVLRLAGIVDSLELVIDNCTYRSSCSKACICEWNLIRGDEISHI